MSRSVLLLLTFALLVCFSAPPLRAEDEPAAPAVEDTPASGGVRARVAGWLKDLRDDAFRVRDAARAGLQREGLRARDLLEAAAEAEDPEVRRTVAAILARAPGVTRVRQGDVHPGDFDALGRVSLDLQGVPLREALASLGKRFGGRFRLPADLPGKPVTLQAEGVPCFTALASLMKLGGLQMPAPFDAQGAATLVLSSEDSPPVPRAFAGPLRVRVEEVTATRSFASKQGPRYVVRLRLDWAPFVQVYQHRTVRVEVARDPDGKPFVAGPGMRSTARHYVGTRAHSAMIEVQLVPGPEGCKPELGVLEISVPMTLRYDRARVVLDDTARIPVVLDISGKPAGPKQEESVSFLSLEPSGQGRGQWILEYAAHLKRDVARGTLEAHVREASGRLSQLYVAGGRSRESDGSVRITARAYRGTKGKPKSLVVSWYRREDPGEIRFRLQNIPLR